MMLNKHESGYKKSGINRDEIIISLSNSLNKHDKIYACWLEGADGLNNIDEYSDIDLVVDVEDGFEDEVFQLAEQELAKLSQLDICYEQHHGHPKLRQRVYHLSSSSPYLEIDFCVQSHSREAAGSTFIQDCQIEAPKILFDKAGVVKFRQRNVNEYQELDITFSQRKVYLLNLSSQYHRIIKYVRRNKFIEAWGYYHKHIVSPLTELLRMKYTPFHTSYSIVHISDHLPKDILSRLESFYEANSLIEIESKTIEGVKWIEELAKY